MKVTVYTTPACRQCKLTKDWLDKNGVGFNPVDLSESPADMEAIKFLGYASAPVVLVNDDGDNQNEKHWYGFRPDLLAEFTLTDKAA